MSNASTGSALRPQELAERALEISTADGCVVIAEESSEANLRWAGNTLTTNGVTRGRTLTVIATIGGQEGTAAGVVSRSNVGLDEVESTRARRRGVKAQEARSAEDARPLRRRMGDDPRPGTTRPPRPSIGVFGALAPALGEAFAAARGDQRDLFGFAEHSVSSTAYLATSTGLRRRHDQPIGSHRGDREVRRLEPARPGWARAPATSPTWTCRRWTPRSAAGWAGRSGASTCRPAATRPCCPPAR